MISAVSLLFDAGHRPRAEEIRELARKSRQFSLSIDPASDGIEDGGWVELLVNGLTFDLVGLGTSAPPRVPDCRHHFALPQGFDQSGLEAITLSPGPHLSGGGAMFPVVRCLASLGAQLAGLEDVRAVAWHPAHTCSAPDYFRRGVTGWIEGGPFPGLGLTALKSNPDGSMQSEGLSLFTSQELRLSPEMCGDRAEAAKVALRLLNWLVEHGRIEQPFTFTGPSGETLELEPVDNSAILHVWKRSH
ncbi:hypothetical protein [Aurantiacibacter marinus]|uniref:hypothetical protein n=1 Tax=Aurantiacibacter marinus TaxID=874156 RepID=UPI000699ED51|nr:hypothetical protein [Aurantiacibacter marinus]